MPRTALIIDFGSTYTKLRAIDLDRAEVIGSGQGPSTVTTDINHGLDLALSDLKDRLGGLPTFEYRLASSSAAGGLGMVTIGLVPKLTAEAARHAALGAGAKILSNYSYELTDADVREIECLNADILLLSGGTDGGNKAVYLANAAALASSNNDLTLQFPSTNIFRPKPICAYEEKSCSFPIPTKIDLKNATSRKSPKSAL